MTKPMNVSQELLSSLDLLLTEAFKIGSLVVLAFAICVVLLIIGREHSHGNKGSAFLLSLTVVLFGAHIVRGLLE